MYKINQWTHVPMNILSELIIIRNYLMDIKVVSLNNHYSTYNNLTLDNYWGQEPITQQDSCLGI